ncbi:MAG: acetamidase, partial [Planctomycetes bacterium]|nr:acetamidase [Planctomycetota bacterium]
MDSIPATPLQYEFSRHSPVRVEIESGGRVVLDSEDALSGQLRKPSDVRNKQTMPWSNPVNGPIAIKGAMPGDALAVRIESIEPLIGQCATYTGGPKALAEWLGTEVPPGTRICPIRNGMIEWSSDIQIPYSPMLGCIGTAPDWGVPTTGPAGNYGG